MSKHVSDPLRAYIGSNAAHRSFRAALANAKALVFVLARPDSTVLQEFLAQAEKAKQRGPGEDFAIGLAGGRSTAASLQAGVHLTETEIALIDSELGGFVPQALGLVHREIHRVFETYLIDLFEEIATREKRVLFSNQKITHKAVLSASPAELHKIIIEERRSELTHGGFDVLEKVFNGMGLPIIPMSEPPPRAKQEDVRRRLILLGAIRNLIEHNRSVVNSEFQGHVPDSGYAIGERISITLTEFGDALSAVECTTDDLNQRAIEKFGVDEVLAAEPDR